MPFYIYLEAKTGQREVYLRRTSYNGKFWTAYKENDIKLFEKKSEALEYIKNILKFNNPKVGKYKDVYFNHHSIGFNFIDEVNKKRVQIDFGGLDS